MFIRVSIPDIIAVTAIGASSWVAGGHEVGWGMWIAFGAFGAGRIVQWIISMNAR